MLSNQKNIIGIIPAYKPDFKLTETVSSVISLDFLLRIVIIDDGSGDEFNEIFQQCEKMPNVDVVHLGVNSGAGGATKAGLQHSIYRYPECIGFVTFDADGQHHPEDVKNVVDAFCQEPDKLAIGVRNFHDPTLHVPFHRRFGNRLTEIIFHIFTGIALTDTQSGLRCFPLAVAKKITQILRSRYDFLLEALLLSADMTDYIQVPIRTIYEDNNKRSHFNPILDSCRIYAVFFRFIGSSLICSVVDYILFALTFVLSKHLLASLIFSRIISVTLNFVLNKRKVFAAEGDTVKQACEFIILAFVLFIGSYFGITLLKTRLNWNPLISKILVEVFLFLLSFLVQRLIVFSKKNKEMFK